MIYESSDSAESEGEKDGEDGQAQEGNKDRNRSNAVASTVSIDVLRADSLDKRRRSSIKELVEIEQTMERTRRLSNMDGDQLLAMFNLNQEGFKKRKEMPGYRKNVIAGLNSEATNPDPKSIGRGFKHQAFDVLYGEKLIQHISTPIYCEHSL